MPAEAQEAIRRYLNAVKRAMTATPANEQRDILNELEAHIREALASRLHSAEATTADVEAILVDMDPPESYAGAVDESTPPDRESASRPEANRRTVGLTALILVLVGLLLTIFVFACHNALTKWGVDAEALAWGSLAVCAIGCLVGWFSFRTSHGKIAAIVGSGLVFFYLAMLLHSDSPSESMEPAPSEPPSRSISP